MLKISTKSQYGLRAMVYLARFPKQISSLKTISKSEEIPFDYLEKIISKLEKASLIKSKKGVSGGYCLAKNPSKIKIGEIIRILEGDIVLVKCISGQKGCMCTRERECLTKSFWKKIQDSLNSALNSLTLKDLIK
jgi:Rrf2 family protein